MFRALVIAAVVAALSGCGEEPPLVDEPPLPASAYAPFFDSWTGVVSGVTSRRQVVSVDMSMTLWGDGDAAMLRGPCEGLTVDLQAYQQKADSIRFMGGTAACAIETECGEGTARIGGITLIPVDLERVAVRIGAEFRPCSGQRSETILMSGVLFRRLLLAPLAVDVEVDLELGVHE